MAPTVMASSATSVAPFQGLKSTAGLPVSRRNSRAAGLGSVSNGGRIRCMQRLIRNPTGEDEVTRGDNSRGSRRRYRRWKRRTWIGLTISPNSTCLEPMIMSKPFTTCQPNWKDCKTHSTFTMLQIFSLKLAHSVVDGPVHLYGYMAVRDLLNPLRNYIFNRTRADPFIVERGGFIQMSGPKRGITMEAMVLTEFDMKIRRGKEEGGDLQLIDGAIVFNNFSCRHARVNTQRIHGDSGAVDISFALLHRAVEATVQVEISELRQGSGLSLCLTASHASDYLLDEIRLFDGVIAAGGCKLNRSVVAVLFDSKFVVALKLSQAGGSDHRVIHRLCVCQPALHGDTIFILKLGFTTIQLKVSWSSMNIDKSLLPRESA